MSTTLKWGLITGLVYVIYYLVINMMGLQQAGNTMLNLGMGTLILILSFIPIYLGVKESREEDLGGYLTLGQGFLIGFKIALIAGFISAVFSLIYLLLIDPDFISRMMGMVEEQWDKAGMPEEQRDMARKMTGYFMNPYSMSAIALMSALFWGLVKGLVAGAILKTEPPPPAAPVA